MINSFGDTKTEKLYRTGEYKLLARLGLKNRAIILLDIMEAVENLEDLQVKAFPPDIRLHKLKGSLKEFWAIDINKLKGFRIIFKFDNNKFEYVKITDYH